ncbi:MAG: polysaccharide biosynthesis C-terminal domain-containing protein [Deltaproteobacteria bacterium]|nr:MAG: polysaccharide biosynthesis C-terminal domain-containing protein [Deltaproteobacteria bacterium]
MYLKSKKQNIKKTIHLDIQFKEKIEIVLQENEESIIEDQIDFLADAFKVSLATFFSRFIGLLRDSMVMNKLGNSAGLDIFNAGLSFQGNIKTQLLEGNICSMLLPNFLKSRLSLGEDPYYLFLRAFLGVCIIITIGMSILFFILACFYYVIYLPGFKLNTDYYVDTLEISNLIFLYFVLLGPIFYITTVLNTYNSFVISAFLPTFTSLAIIISLSIFNIKPYFSLSIGHILGLFLQILILIPTILNKNISLKPSFLFNIEPIKKLSNTFGPALWGTIIAQTSFLFTRNAASYFESGSLSCFYAADRLIQMFSGIITNSISLITLSQLCMFSGNDPMSQRSIIATWHFSLSFSLFFLIPISSILFISGLPIISVIYFHGNCCWFDIKAMAISLNLLSFTLITYAITKISTQVFFVLNDFSTPNKIMFYGCLSQVFCIYTLSKLDISGLGVAYLVSNIIQSYLSIYHLKEHLCEDLQLKKLLSSFKKSCIASLCTMIIVHKITSIGMWDLGPTPFNIIILLFALFLGFIVYFIITILLKSEEATFLLKAFKTKTKTKF